MATSIKITASASGTGVATISAPSGSGGQTFTLETTGGTVVTSASTLDATKLSGALPALDGSNLTGAGVPSGTKMAFFQASAPTGWTQVTSQNNKVLRVVSGSGGGTGGSWATSSGPGHSLSAGAHTLSTSQMPSHTHTLSHGGSSFGSTSNLRLDGGSNAGTYNSNSTGGGSSHSHSLSGSITAPAYIDMIIATKN
jgi:hypothetical protein